MQIEKINAMFGHANAIKLLNHFKEQSHEQLAIMALTGASTSELAELVSKIIEVKNAPTWVVVPESSNIAGIRYDDIAEVLDVQFYASDDSFFRYQKFPYFEYEQFINAESKGTYFARYIKGQFESEKLTMDGE